MTGFLQIYWVVGKQHKLVLTILLKRKQFCQESLRGRYCHLCFFFYIYINDISNSADQLKFYLFADDTHMLYADRNLKSLETMVNAELLTSMTG